MRQFILTLFLLVVLSAIPNSGNAQNEYYVPDSVQNWYLYDDSIENLIDSTGGFGNPTASGFYGYRNIWRCPDRIIKKKFSKDTVIASNKYFVQVYYNDFEKLENWMWNNAKSQNRNWNNSGPQYPEGYTNSNENHNCPSTNDSRFQVTWYQKENTYLYKDNSSGITSLRIKTDQQAPTSKTCLYDLGPGVTPRFQELARDFEHMSGYIETNKFFKMGMFQARIKLPELYGLWPAFWLFGGESDKYDELDIFEFMSNETHIMKSTFYQESKDTRCGPYKYKKTSAFFRDWHVYTCYWLQDKITIWVDSDFCLQFKKYHGINTGGNTIKKDKWVRQQLTYPENPMQIIFNVAALSCGTARGDFSSGPRYMDIDWVKVFYQMDCDKDMVIDEVSDLPPNPKYYNVINGRDINIDLNYKLPAGYFVKLMHSEILNVNNLEVGKDAVFIAEPASQYCIPWSGGVPSGLLLSGSEKNPNNLKDLKIGNNGLDGMIKIYSEHDYTNLTAEIYDTNGQLIWGDLIDINGQRDLNLTKLPPGVYFLRLSAGGYTDRRFKVLICGQ